MKISELIQTLQSIQAEHGDIECQLMDDGKQGVITTDETIFAVPEKYEDGVKVNIRTWPY